MYVAGIVRQSWGARGVDNFFGMGGTEYIHM